MKKSKTVMSQVKSGLWLAGLSLVFVLVAYLFLGGVTVLCFPGDVDRGSFVGRHASIVATISLVVSVAVMIPTMNRWVKVLAGLLALAFLNGVLSVWSGHVLANPARPISRLDALYMTAFFAAAAVLASTLRGRKLNSVDRISVLAFAFSLAYLLGYRGSRDFGQTASFGATDFTLMAIGLCCLLAAWAYSRVRAPQSESPINK